MQLLQRKTFRVFTTLVLVITALTLTLKFFDYQKLKPQTTPLLAVPAYANNQHFQIGSFNIYWKTNGQLVVTKSTDTTQIVWQTINGQSFVAAAQATETVKESRGSFFISDEQKKILRYQSIDTIIFNGQKLYLTGLLSDGNKNSVAYQFTLQSFNHKQLEFSCKLNNPAYNRTHLIYASDNDEQFFGMGMQFTHFNLKGHRVPVFVSEQGIGRGTQPLTALVNMVAKSGGNRFTTYAAVPHYISSKMRSLFLQNNEYATFDFTQKNIVQIEVFCNQITGQILCGNSPAELIDIYTNYAGKMRKLPDWINSGAIIGMQGGTQKVQQIYNQLLELETPIAAFWLQDWVGQRKTTFGKQLWWNWQLDRNHYQGWNFLLSTLDDNNIQVMTYINPFLVDVSDNFNHTKNYFIEAEAQGYLIKTPQKKTYLIPNTSFSAGLVDLTNPEAYQWLKQIIIQEMVATGAKGWMADFGEALPYDAVLHTGNPKNMHNRYPELWAQLNREVLDEIPNGNQYVFFSRSGFTKSPQYSSLFWLGDQMVTWDKYDGIKTAVTGLLSSGMSGYAFNHSDIGGYTAITDFPLDHKRSKELLLRWIELNAFTAIFRTHEGNRPDENYQFYNDTITLKHFSRFAKIYAALAPYRKQLITQASQTGLPVVRHPFIHYPDDPYVLKINYQQFMLGPDMMVAPVLDAETNEVKIYLPKGRWKQIWNNKTFESDGELFSAQTPIGQPAVFYKPTDLLNRIVSEIEKIH